MDTALTIGAIVLVILGGAGIVLPGLPDLPLVYAGLVLRSAATDFADPSVATLLWLLIVLIAVALFEVFAGAASAKQFGASRAGVIGAIIGGVLGLLLFLVSPWALFVLPIAGAVLGELYAGRTKEQALKSGVGTAVGFVAVIAVKTLATLLLVGVLLASFF
ncbi:DUF456 family protein [Candidatus Berkelbacteria bacterium]|nr:DUF456 family protein [Candidatus Berkelbacteria bacterium]